MLYQRTLNIACPLYEGNTQHFRNLKEACRCHSLLHNYLLQHKVWMTSTTHGRLTAVGCRSILSTYLMCPGHIWFQLVLKNWRSFEKVHCCSILVRPWCHILHKQSR